MKRSPIRRKPRGPNKAGSNVPHMREVWERPCCVCRLVEAPRNIAHHITGAGMGQKTPDDWVIPLCPKHHRELHDFRGYFASFSRWARKAWELEHSLRHRPKESA